MVHTMAPEPPYVLMLCVRLTPVPQPLACSLIDEPVADLAGQEDVWMQPQRLLVQQVAQRAIQVAQAEVGAEGHQGLGGVGRHAGGGWVDQSGTGAPRGSRDSPALTGSLAEPQPGEQEEAK